MKIKKASKTKLPEISAETTLQLLFANLRLPNSDFTTVSKKRVGLLMLGVRKEVVEELCEEVLPDREAILREVRARVERDRREMEREK